MIRRRRPNREIPFNLDCFLDVITNVVGIIVRLIIVAWVGGRAYHTVMQALPAASPESLPTLVSHEDAARKTLARHQQELAQTEQRLQTALLRLDQVRTGASTTAQQLAQLKEEEKRLLQERHDLIADQVKKELAAKGTTLTVAELKPKVQQLEKEIRQLQETPSAKKPLRYHTPVSRIVQSEELHFECKNGRVAFIDLLALLTDPKRDVQERGNELQAQRILTGISNPIGAFELNYTLEVEEANSTSVAISWQVVPIAPVRGEPEALALQPGSKFREIVDRVLPEHTTVTIWVYPESFALYRQLRDYLHQKNIEVAGRPLPEGHPIASSRNGRRSRGQ